MEKNISPLKDSEEKKIVESNITHDVEQVEKVSSSERIVGDDSFSLRLVPAKKSGNSEASGT